MKIKALVTCLVLGSSSLALAAPSYTTPYAAPNVRDHRQLPPAPAPVAQYQGQFGWQKPLARPVLLADNTRVNGWSNINVAQGTRAFTKLELKANSGKTDLDRVMITFGNGQRQVVSLRGKLDGKINAGKSLTIDLDGNGRFIKSVMLIGSSGRRASIDVVAV
ncbi:MAG TPA: hypothetical protein VFV99_12825 [Kofleriaceae bacterium]|nr:hypothetical protein [Kofleriaceae bacterium]